MKFIIAGNTLFATLAGKPYSITNDHPQFVSIRQALLEGSPEGEVIAMFEAALAAAKYMQGKVTSDGGALYYQGEQVHGVIAERILTFMAKGLPYQPLVNFLERLMKNPSKRSIDELYGFIEKNELPITEDGFILGYKGVTSDYKDLHTNSVDNSIGARPFMKRRDVDDNFRLDCSNGYHVGSRHYATGFGPKTVIVKIDPMHVVSVPENDCGKMRIEGYEVVSEYAGELPAHVAISNDPYRDENVVVRFLKRLFRK
jgi:hypothetical protein